MAAEEDIVFRINYQLEGVERSISTSRRALFTLNAIRLSIRDIQQVLSGPTIANVLFTAIQLTRTLTQARRLTKALTAEQAAAGVSGLFGGVGGRRVGAVAGGARALALGQTTLVSRPAQTGFFSTLVSLAGVNPIATGIFVGTFAIGLGAHLYFEQQKKIRGQFREYNREVAKSQGLEP